MEIIKRELARHMLLVNRASDVVYSNPIHLKGIGPYRDKKRLYDMGKRISERKQLLRRRDLQILERLFLKYSR